MSTSTTTSQQLRKVPASAAVREILDIVNEDGGVIIEKMISPDQVRRFNEEIDKPLTQLHAGSNSTDGTIAEFHGSNTKRLTNLITHSKTFREELVAHALVAALADEIFLKNAGAYWMSTAQVIEIGPGNKPQVLHRDLENFYTAVQAGPAGPEVTINFLTALTDFTDENGATRVIPGSNKWDDYEDRGKPDMTIPAEMNAGDVLFISGKVVHGGGHNRTTDFYRRAVAWTFQPGYLTPEEAYPFIVDLELAKSLPERVQRYIGFRSQYVTGSPGLWQVDYEELGDRLGL